MGRGGGWGEKIHAQNSEQHAEVGVMEWFRHWTKAIITWVQLNLHGCGPCFSVLSPKTFAFFSKQAKYT